MSSIEKTLSKTKIALLGSSGKMGQKIIELVKDKTWADRFEIIAELNSKSVPADIPSTTDVVVDFSNAASTLKWTTPLSEKKIPYLVCSTGFNSEEFSQLKAKLSKQAWAFIPNTSLGVYAFIRCLCGLVAFFKDIKSVEIHDVHHIHKKDKPSGTALLIKAAILDTLNKKNESLDIPIHSGREGEVIGTHSVIIQRSFDRLILTHEAQDRKLFAEGALALAEKLALKKERDKPYSFDELL
jgi:4-hydroxy-tetrahydrodipicolinate reductase